jgi:hypothetical protein
MEMKNYTKVLVWMILGGWIMVIPAKAQNFIDTDVQASFYNKVFSLMDADTHKPIIILYDEYFESAAKSLESSFSKYLYSVKPVSSSEFGSLQQADELHDSIVYLLTDDEQISNHAATLSDMIISRNLEDLRQNHALFCLTNENDHLKLYISSGFVLDHKLKIASRILNVARVVK